MSKMIENLFLNNKNPINYHDDNSDTIIELDQSNIGKYFDCVYILVKRNNEPIPVEFYDRLITQDVMTKVNSNLLIHKTKLNILKNINHFNKIIILSDDQLKAYNIFNYTLGIKNIVIPIFNIAYQNLLKYIEQYEYLNTLEDIYKLKVLNQYFGVKENNNKANEYLCMLMSNIEDSKYWSLNYNCSVNLTSIFNARYFKFQSSRLENKTVGNIVKELFENKVKISNSDDDYIRDMSQKNNYSDISAIIAKKGFKLYRISTKSDLSYQDINQLFDTLNEKQKFILFSNLIVSKKNAHLVVNNFNILSIMSEPLKTHAPLFRYLFSYTWIKFYFEECIKKSYVNIKDNFIFDINTASKLPVFPFDHNNPKSNPYMPILVSDNDLKPSENICGIQDYYTNDKTFINGGICNLSEFLFRMNIFCTCNPNNNLFDGFDFKKYKVAITGSIITACVQRSHPLMSLFKNPETDQKIMLVDQLSMFFNEYYAKSDIDVMLLAKDNFTFIDNSRMFYNTIVNNICKFNYYADASHVKLNLIKLGYLFVSDEFIINNINFDESMQIVDKVKYVFDNINDVYIRNKFRPYYEQLKINYMNDLIKDYTPNELINMKSKYPEIFENNDVDFKIYVNHKKNAQNHISTDETFFTKDIKDIDLVYTFKFKIESPYINHSFELFPVQYDDFFSIVARFHLPCVRGLYNGTNVYLTPSCISAHMTYMNIDYKYVCGTKDPIEIINKNRMRGFGTWLNAREKKLFIKYSSEIPFWNNLYKVDKKIPKNRKKNSDLYKSSGSTGPHGSSSSTDTTGSTGPHGSSSSTDYSGSTGPSKNFGYSDFYSYTGPVDNNGSPDYTDSTDSANYDFSTKVIPYSPISTGNNNTLLSSCAKHDCNTLLSSCAKHDCNTLLSSCAKHDCNTLLSSCAKHDCNTLKGLLQKKLDNTMDKIIFLGPLSLNHKMFKPRLYNTDDYTESMYVDTSNRYNNFILPQTLSEYNKCNIRNNINYEENNINYDSLIAISSSGCIVPFKKYVINLTWKIYNKNKKELDNKKCLHKH